MPPVKYGWMKLRDCKVLYEAGKKGNPPTDGGYLRSAAVYIVSNIIGSLRCFTSFPWWSAFVFGGIYFGPVLLLEIAVYGVLVLLEKKT